MACSLAGPSSLVRVFVCLNKPLSAAMFHLGASLSLDPPLLDVLPFSAAPQPSAFCLSSDSANFLITFYSGFIMLWAIRVHVLGISLDALLPSSCLSSSSSASSSSLPGPSSDLLASTSSIPPASLSTDVTLATLVSQLSAQLLSLSQQVAAIQHSQSSVAPARSSVPVPVLPPRPPCPRIP